MSTEKNVLIELDISFICNVFGGDEGLMLYILEKKKDDIKITDLCKYRGYRWNESEAIWEKIYKCQLLKHVPELLEKNILIYISNKRILINCLDKETQKEEIQKHKDSIIKLEKVLKHVRTEYGQRSIINLMLPNLYDENFIDRLDNSEYNIDYFPISKRRVVYLPDSTLHERKRNHYFTHYRDVDIVDEPDKYLNVVNFMKRIRMCNNLDDSNDMYNLSHILAGASLSGRRHDKNILIWYGTGNNAKGTSNYITSKILGNFYLSSPPYIFIDHGKASAGTHQSYLETLRGKRYFNFAELKQTDRLNESLLKSVCSSVDTLSIRTAGSENTHTLRVYGLPSLETNWIPNITISDKALVDRLRIIFCNAKFVSHNNPDPNKLEFKAMSQSDLEIFIQEHLNSLFLWYLDGCRLYYQNKCNISFPSICLTEKASLLNEQDYNSQIFDDICTLDPPVTNTTITIPKHYACKNNIYQRYIMEIKNNPKFPKNDVLIKKKFIERFNSYLESHNCLYPHNDNKKRFIGWSFVSISVS